MLHFSLLAKNYFCLNILIDHSIFLPINKSKKDLDSLMV